MVPLHWNQLKRDAAGGVVTAPRWGAVLEGLGGVRAGGGARSSLPQVGRVHYLEVGAVELVEVVELVVVPARVRGAGDVPG
jgi:hypothetical protein